MSLSVAVGKSQRQTYAAPLTLDRQNLGLNSHRYEARRLILVVSLTTSGTNENPSCWTLLSEVYLVRLFEAERSTLTLGPCCSPSFSFQRSCVLSLAVLNPTSLGFQHGLKTGSSPGLHCQTSTLLSRMLRYSLLFHI